MINLKFRKCMRMMHKTASFGYLNEKATHCGKHQKENMFNLKSKKCEINGCLRHAKYNFKSMKVKFCKEHSLPDMIDVAHKRCKMINCDNMLNNLNKYQDYCHNCFVHLFPDHELSRNFKTKEKAVREFILKEFIDEKWETDSKIKDGCSKRRPDLLCKKGNFAVIVEIDENQHTEYNTTCENKRLMEISQDLNHIPIVFIRFNPDDYKKGIKK